MPHHPSKGHSFFHFVMDHSGLVTAVDPQMLRILGRPASDVIYQPLTPSLFSDSRVLAPEAARRFCSFLLRPGSGVQEFCLGEKEASYPRVMWARTPVVDEDGQSVSVVLTGTWLPDRNGDGMAGRAAMRERLFVRTAALKQANRRLREGMEAHALAVHALDQQVAYFKSIVERMNVLVCTIDPEYRIRYRNRAMGERLREVASDAPCHEVLFGRSTPCDPCVMDMVRNGGSGEVVFRMSQNQRWLKVDTAPVIGPEGIFRELVVVIVDETTLRSEAEELAEAKDRLEDENRYLRAAVIGVNRFGPLVGKSIGMQAVFRSALEAAGTDLPVVITGESGTGKELLARVIHETGKRQDAPFVAVNCGAIPETLFESAFFGFQKGSFTGAMEDRKGFFAAAQGGVLFLDEVGELPLSFQVKLLRVLDGQGYSALGDHHIRIPDVRVIAATNRDLETMVTEGKMRSDFFYRIHVLTLHMPPLRERDGDIPLLSRHFADLCGLDRKILNRETLTALEGHDWPGNVRELQNVIFRLKVVGHLDGGFGKTVEQTRPETLKLAVEALEIRMIRGALERCGGNRTAAGKVLGIDRKTLRRKMARYEIGA